jgi:hypothetical protein
MRNYPDLFIENHLVLFENLGYITQIAHDNEEFIKLIGIVSPDADD